MKRAIGTWQEQTALKLKWTLASTDVQVQLQRASEIGTEDVRCLAMGAVPNYSRAAGKLGRFLLTYD